VRGDLRSRRVAVVTDSVLNPPAGGADHLTPLTEAGWGLMVLPPAGLPADTERATIAAIADQVVTFLDDDYEVALGWPGDERTERLIEALSAIGRRIERRIDLLD
jgi:hypothetical protein